jgi:hypothetical protein
MLSSLAVRVFSLISPFLVEAVEAHAVAHFRSQMGSGRLLPRGVDARVGHAAIQCAAEGARLGFRQ